MIKSWMDSVAVHIFYASRRCSNEPIQALDKLHIRWRDIITRFCRTHEGYLWGDPVVIEGGVTASQDSFDSQNLKTETSTTRWDFQTLQTGKTVIQMKLGKMR